MAKKSVTPKTKPPARNHIEVKVDLGRLEPNKTQIAKLKARVKNQLLTWVKADVKDKAAAPIVTITEGNRPPGGGDEGGNG